MVALLNAPLDAGVNSVRVQAVFGEQEFRVAVRDQTIRYSHAHDLEVWDFREWTNPDAPQAAP